MRQHLPQPLHAKTKAASRLVTHGTSQKFGSRLSHQLPRPWLPISEAEHVLPSLPSLCFSQPRAKCCKAKDQLVTTTCSRTGCLLTAAAGYSRNATLMSRLTPSSPFYCYANTSLAYIKAVKTQRPVLEKLRTAAGHPRTTPSDLSLWGDLFEESSLHLTP